jgi:hypothetical protein
VEEGVLHDRVTREGGVNSASSSEPFIGLHENIVAFFGTKF